MFLALVDAWSGLPVAEYGPVLAAGLVGVALLDVAPRERSLGELLSDYWLFATFAAFVLVAVALFLTKGEEFYRELLTEYWLPVLFAIFVLEGAMLLYFAPSESLVPVAVGSPMADSVTDYAAIIAVSVVAATIGQYLLFLVARRGGREYLLDRSWFRVSDDHLQRFEDWFDRWGPLAIPASNAFFFTRGMLTVPAGFARMDSRTFVVLSAVGTLVFETALAAVALGVLEVL